MGMTMTQKILAAHAGLDSVKAGQLISARLDLDNGWDEYEQGLIDLADAKQELADSVFNTALHYELPVLKRYAFDLLRQVTPGTMEDVMSQRLRKVLHYFPEIDLALLDEIPPLSLLREFIGGSTMDKD